MTCNNIYRFVLNSPRKGFLYIYIYIYQFTNIYINLPIFTNIWKQNCHGKFISTITGFMRHTLFPPSITDWYDCTWLYCTTLFLQYLLLQSHTQAQRISLTRTTEITWGLLYYREMLNREGEFPDCIVQYMYCV